MPENNFFLNFYEIEENLLKKSCVTHSEDYNSLIYFSKLYSDKKNFTKSQKYLFHYFNLNYKIKIDYKNFSIKIFFGKTTKDCIFYEGLKENIIRCIIIHLNVLKQFINFPYRVFTFIDIPEVSITFSNKSEKFIVKEKGVEEVTLYIPSRFEIVYEGKFKFNKKEIKKIMEGACCLSEKKCLDSFIYI